MRGGEKTISTKSVSIQQKRFDFTRSGGIGTHLTLRGLHLRTSVGAFTSIFLGSLFLCTFSLHLVKVQHHVGVSTQLSLEPFERYSYHVTMMHAASCRELAHLQP